MTSLTGGILLCLVYLWGLNITTTTEGNLKPNAVFNDNKLSDATVGGDLLLRKSMWPIFNWMGMLKKVGCKGILYCTYFPLLRIFWVDFPKLPIRGEVSCVIFPNLNLVMQLDWRCMYLLVLTWKRKKETSKDWLYFL